MFVHTSDKAFSFRWILTRQVWDSPFCILRGSQVEISKLCCIYVPKALYFKGGHRLNFLNYAVSMFLKLCILRRSQVEISKLSCIYIPKALYFKGVTG